MITPQLDPLPSGSDSAVLFSRLQAEGLLSGWHKARAWFFCQLLLALLQTSRVGVRALARSLAAEPGPAAGKRAGCRPTVASRAKQLQRFWSFFDLLGGAQGELVALLVRWSGVEPPWVLSLDRSDWQPPKQCRAKLGWINFLVLGIVDQGVTYPLYWSLRPRPGASAAPERIALLERFLARFGPASVRFVCADREFGTGRRWLEFLHTRGLDWRLRVAVRARLSNTRGQPASVGALFAGLPVGAHQTLAGVRRLCGVPVRVAALRLDPSQLAQSQAAKRQRGHAHPGDELVVIVANGSLYAAELAQASAKAAAATVSAALSAAALKAARHAEQAAAARADLALDWSWTQALAEVAALAAAESAAAAAAQAAAAAALELVRAEAGAPLLEDYRLRWSIENLFSALKTRGFCLESTHLDQPVRLERLLGVLAAAFVLAHRTGLWMAAAAPGRWRLSAKRGRRLQSLVQVGLTCLNELLQPRGGFDRRARAGWAALVASLGQAAARPRKAPSGSRPGGEPTFVLC